LKVLNMHSPVCLMMRTVDDLPSVGLILNELHHIHTYGI